MRFMLIEGKQQAVDGDLTTTGATCQASGPHYRVKGCQVLRQGDKTTPCPRCGEVGTLIEGVQSFMIEGRATVVDGALVACGCPSGSNRVMAIGGLAQSASPTPTEQASPAEISNRTSFITPTKYEPSEKTSKVGACDHFDMMEAVANFIAGEMNRNITHPSVLKMKKLTSFDGQDEKATFQKLPWYARLLPPNFQAMEKGNIAAAMALWVERVGQNRPWDHKAAIGQQFGGAWQKQGEVDYFYDIWSNIHYGYVGRAGGLSESVLLDGAGLEQIASDSIRKIQKWDERKGPHRSADIDGVRAWDDIGDRVAISIGVNLYKHHPTGGITARLLMAEVLALPRSSWGDGIRDHICK
ncbi:polymorphic toxin type 44 domain-containing protein [Pseudomonas sp. PSKL.D1]|uniref:polymorphic toxin type 44 domain-containing protein n=1 Tax=Pseudomonas sp. PSKL.D1 TaxID=3029060 RepID=UPI0023811154|nr:polymorphic toxin type 44 domain-containing protein [Pseudomonas sp. PSKL.D1]WDY56085.1 polymorphic toxin type 44 domain-containing protein [Pseudomonas sp. PSKL.D1]